MSAKERLRAWSGAHAHALTALGLVGMAGFVASLLATSLGLLDVVDHLGASALSLGLYCAAMALARFGGAAAPARVIPARRRPARSVMGSAVGAAAAAQASQHWALKGQRQIELHDVVVLR